jgi:molybdopterin synthase sulfur carrier subunit
MRVRVQTFAALRDYFPKDFEMEWGGDTIRTLRQALATRNLDAIKILQASRAAVNDEFVDDAFKLREGNVIFFYPPSSGG